MAAEEVPVGLARGLFTSLLKGEERGGERVRGREWGGDTNGERRSKGEIERREM